MQPNIFDNHRSMLQAACRKPDHPEFTKPNSDLDTVIAVIKAERPEAFLTPDDLEYRCFVHAPTEIPGKAPTPYRSAMRYRLSATEQQSQSLQKSGR